jgi:hypothetical protein
MLEKQEGLAGGYYTGIATIAEGRLHYRKVVGDVATLRAQTDAVTLPGPIGIAHSRTPSGGGVEWSHPFIDCASQMAYVAQGSRGFFSERVGLRDAGDELVGRGHTLRSACREKVGAYPVLAGGACVHISDILCHVIEDTLATCGDRVEAMRQAYMRWPGEIVGMTIHQSEPERIVVACVNQPLVIGRDESATYLASVGLALPPSIRWRMPVPPNVATAVRRDGVEIRPFDLCAEPVDTNCPFAEAESIILDVLKRNPGATWGKLYGATKSLWPDGHLTLNTPMAYGILERLCRSDRVRLETIRVPGMVEQGTVPQARAYLT